jgi:hypothetical protein
VTNFVDSDCLQSLLWRHHLTRLRPMKLHVPGELGLLLLQSLSVQLSNSAVKQFS